MTQLFYLFYIASLKLTNSGPRGGKNLTEQQSAKPYSWLDVATTVALRIQITWMIIYPNSQIRMRTSYLIAAQNVQEAAALTERKMQYFPHTLVVRVQILKIKKAETVRHQLNASYKKGCLSRRQSGLH
jgi:hypothetical protein